MCLQSRNPIKLALYTANIYICGSQEMSTVFINLQNIFDTIQPFSYKLLKMKKSHFKMKFEKKLKNALNIAIL